jgi:glycosyltransferase involved in cell wall biosynthesis
MPIKRRRIISLGHSYCVALNRRLPTEMNRLGGDKWEVTVAAPAFFYGDLRPIKTEECRGEKEILELLPAYFSALPHLFFYGKRLRQLLNDNWDIVHCWEEPYVLAGGQVAYWTPKQSRLVFWTGQTQVKEYPPPFAQIERYCFKRCAGWLSRGQLGIDAMLERGHGNKPFDSIGLGVDLDVFFPDKEAGLTVMRQLGWPEKGAPVIGYIGRFVEEKGLGILIAGLDQISTPWRAIFLGGGPMLEAMERWAVRHKDRVRIVTAVSHERVPQYLNAFDVLCAPSLTTSNWREIFGRMVIEAFACAVPVLGSDSGELPNVIGDAGLILPEADIPGWAHALENILDSHRLREDLGKRGFDRVNRHFTWTAIARKHLEFCERLLDPPVC